MSNSNSNHGPTADDTTADEWSTLPGEAAALWRGLDALQGNTARVVREARGYVRAGNVDALGDPGELLQQMRRALDTLARTGRTTEAAMVATLGELAADYWQHISEQRDAAPTGLGKLDQALGGGLQARRLVVLLGAPGSGKTTLANQIAEHVANGGRPVVYLTTEDPPAALLAKTLARVGSFDYGAVLQGRENMRAAINSTLADVSRRQSASRLLYIESGGGLVLEGLTERARAHFAQYGDAHGGGRGLLVVDYLQRVARAQREASGGVVRELREAVTLLTERLRDLARDLDCTVLALASQNRASGYGAGGNALASAKESGDIEYTADVIAALGEDEKRVAPLHHEARVLNIVKNRQGETRKLDLDWYPVRQQFTEAAK